MAPPVSYRKAGTIQYTFRTFTYREQGMLGVVVVVVVVGLERHVDEEHFPTESPRRVTETWGEMRRRK